MLDIKNILLITSAIFLIAPVNTLFSQESPIENTYGLEEIVVTAQKREDSIQTVPIAITAVSGDILDQRAVVNLESLQGLVPGAQIGQFANTPHGAVFNIRGMGAIEPDPYAGSAVLVTIDGVPQYFNMTSLVDLFDVERVEVLRGPQGTLFGASCSIGPDSWPQTTAMATVQSRAPPRGRSLRSRHRSPLSRAGRSRLGPP